MPFPLEPTSRDAIEEHFKRRGLVWSEAYFLDRIREGKPKLNIYWATIALRDCGTRESVGALKPLIYYPMQDVKCVSILTIAHLAGPAETEFYAKALLDPKYPEKDYAAWAIKDSADERAIDAVLTYLHKNLARIRRDDFYNGTVENCLVYLGRHAEQHDEVVDLFEKIDPYWDKLDANHKRVATEVAYFSKYLPEIEAEEQAEEAQRREQAAKEAARDADLTDRRCPECGSPCPTYRKTCKVCGLEIGRA